MSQHGVTVWRSRVGWRWFVRAAPHGFRTGPPVKQSGWAATQKAAKRRAMLQQDRIWKARQ